MESSSSSSSSSSSFGDGGGGGGGGDKNIDVAFGAPPEDTERLEDDERNYKNNAHSLPAGVVGSDSNYVSYYDAASLYPSSGKLASLPPSCARVFEKIKRCIPSLLFFPPRSRAQNSPHRSLLGSPYHAPPPPPLFGGGWEGGRG